MESCSHNNFAVEGDLFYKIMAFSLALMEQRGRNDYSMLITQSQGEAAAKTMECHKSRTAYLQSQCYTLPMGHILPGNEALLGNSTNVLSLHEYLLEKVVLALH